MGHAYILKSEGQPYVQVCVLTYFSRFTDKCRDFFFFFDKIMLDI